MKQKLGKYLCSLLVTMSIIIGSAVGIIPGMSMTAQAATTLTDTFTTNTGATEYTGDYSKVSGYVWIGATNKALALTDPNTFGTTKYGGPITIETLNGEIIDKVVLSGVSNPQNAYVHPSSGNVTNTLKSGDCCYNLNDDGAIEIENINSTTLTISFHPGYGGTCFYANVVVYCHEVPVDITGVELNKTSTALTVGETDTLTATVNPDNSDHTVTWSSDNESVATVSDGVVTAVSAGTANITVTATNGTEDTSDDKTATCTVTVNAITFNVTYSVVNGTWSDGTTADKTETVQSGSAPASVPSGMIADSGFTGGSWNADPSSATITGDTTFTYTFEAIPTYTVTYSVVNGTWSDGTTADKTETVVSGASPASIPSGMIASSGYTGGAWDTDPSGATITGDTTYTYTFTAVPTYTVTYSVVNGTWSDGTTADKTETVASGLSPASIPSGMIASSGYTGGTWDTDPSGATITGNTTYTYTFTAVPTYTVTYSVVNGTWADGTTADKTETVASGASPASIPAGMIASSGYTGGSWDTAPASATITGDKTFTYAFEAVPVYYTVAGGSNSTFTIGDASDLVITVKRNVADDACFSHFIGIEIDGKALVSGTDYTAVAGSTVVTIKAATLNRLSAGGHTITIVFDDGKIETSVTAKAASGTSNGGSAVPSTGESLAPTLFIGIAFIAVAGTLFTVMLVQKKRKSVR